MDLQCVVPITNGYFGLPVKNVESLPYNTFLCGLVSCHSLTIIDKQLTGDPLDLKVRFLLFITLKGFAPLQGLLDIVFVDASMIALLSCSDDLQNEKSKKYAICHRISWKTK